MTGRVVCFRPRLGRGILRTDSGDVLPFAANEDHKSIDGDDIIEFALEGSETDRTAKMIRLVEKGFVRAPDYQNMLRELFGSPDSTIVKVE